ncbi:MAG: hypothetical protein LBC29_02830 [Propionibacteriaceae bacterium]|jgi:hypothetical protein|nr:hypothetical protein [Propionibacteriaceae bacterium]
MSEIPTSDSAAAALQTATAELRAAEAAWSEFRRQMPLGTDDLHTYEVRMYLQFGTGTKKEFSVMKARLLKARAAYLSAKKAAAQAAS